MNNIAIPKANIFAIKKKEHTLNTLNNNNNNTNKSNTLKYQHEICAHLYFILDFSFYTFNYLSF